MSSLLTNQPMRRKLSFALPAVVFLSFAALENVEIAAVADTIASLTADEPDRIDVAPATVVPAIYEQPIRVACPHSRGA
jgi:hypothetical protein